MADLRRGTPEPTVGPLRIEHRPGMAQELLRELAPLLAEEGFDVDNLEVDDLATLQAAMQRAVERRNLELSTPVGAARDVAVVTLRRVVQAIVDGESAVAGELLDQVRPESPDHSVATVASCLGIALGLLDAWLSGQDDAAPAGLAAATRLPGGHWTGKRAARDILVLAGKGTAFSSMDAVIVRQGGPQALAGSVLALAAAVAAWAPLIGTASEQVVDAAIR